MKFKIKDIQPNPFRHMDRYPMRRDKVEALRESLRTTGFWDNVVARINGDGKPQIAYGHHRLTALREEYASGHEVSLIIRELSDEDMLKIMARENMEEWGTSASVEQETVRAVVEAFAAGQITLEPPPVDTPQSQLRYAPSFVVGDVGPQGAQRSYTVNLVGRFLGWTTSDGKAQHKVGDALAALEFIEEGILSERDFAGLTTKQAQAVVQQARKAKADREAQERLQRQEAEKQRKAAEKAEQDRQRAEKERAKREEQAAKARDEAKQREAEEKMYEAQQRAREAEEAKQRAERQQKQAEERARKERERGQQQAQKVGRRVSQGLRSGEAGYKQAGDLAAKAQPKTDKAPPNIDKFARQLANQINKILAKDTTAQSLDTVIKYQTHLRPDSVEELQAVLEALIGRVDSYLNQLGYVESEILGEVLELTQ